MKREKYTYIKLSSSLVPSKSIKMNVHALKASQFIKNKHNSTKKIDWSSENSSNLKGCAPIIHKMGQHLVTTFLNCNEIVHIQRIISKTVILVTKSWCKSYVVVGSVHNEMFSQGDNDKQQRCCVFRIATIRALHYINYQLQCTTKGKNQISYLVQILGFSFEDQTQRSGVSTYLMIVKRSLRVHGKLLEVYQQIQHASCASYLPSASLEVSSF